MKISNKEKKMLYLLGSIIIGFLYYQFVYSYQLNQLEEKSKAESEVIQKYNTAVSTINSMEDKKSNVKVLKAKINDETVPFYPTINEEKIILELDQLLENSGLNGGMTFQPIVTNSVESSKKEEKSLAQSSLQGMADQYNHEFKDTDTTQEDGDKAVNNSGISESNNNNSKNADAANNANSSRNPNENSKKDSKDSNKDTIQYLKCEVKFEGKYEELDEFLNSIDQNEKKIVVNSIKVESNTSGGIKGTADLEFYSIPKSDDELESYLKWDSNKTYGKDVPFGADTASTGTSVTSSNKTVSSGQKTKEASDFVATVKPIDSDLPTIMMGKANDDLRTSYVYADSNSEENVEMILTQEGDKYYYKYKTSKGTFPANYDGLGEEFAPSSSNIVLDILSRSRIDGNDNSSIRLKITNKTDKTLDVNVIGDDSNNPRVNVEGDLSNISVNNK